MFNLQKMSQHAMNVAVLVRADQRALNRGAVTCKVVTGGLHRLKDLKIPPLLKAKINMGVYGRSIYLTFQGPCLCTCVICLNFAIAADTTGIGSIRHPLLTLHYQGTAARLPH